MVKQAAVVVFLCAAVACSNGSTTTSPSPTPAPGAATFSLTGQVTDGTTGSAISGATLSIGDSVNAGKSTTTDSAGNYSFGAAQQASFTVTVVASSYVSQAKSVTLSSNQTLSFQLTHVASAPAMFTVNGNVTDGTSGGVLPGIVVLITDGANAGKSAKTDAGGNYTIGDVAPATFAISATAASYQTSTRQAAVSANTRVDFVLQRMLVPAPPPAEPACTAPPSAPAFLGWSNTGSPAGSVQLFWEASPGPTTSYIVEVGTTTGGTDVAIIETGSDSPSYTLSGLTTSVDLYHVRVRAKSMCGVSGPSNEARPRIE